MGTVYLALDPALRRQVALKVLRADTDDQRERFRREARIVARLQHPNIVAIYAVGEHDQQPFIAMEYIEGEPLSDGIRRRTPWSLHRKLQMARRPVRRPGVRAPCRRRPPRREALESDRQQRLGDAPPARFRHRPRRRRRSHHGPDDARQHRRDAELHVAGADHRAGARSPERHLRGRPGPVRAARLPPGVPRRQPRHADVPHRARLGRTAARAPARSRPRALCGGRTGHGAIARRQVSPPRGHADRPAAGGGASQPGSRRAAHGAGCGRVHTRRRVSRSSGRAPSIRRWRPRVRPTPRSTARVPTPRPPKRTCQPAGRAPHGRWRRARRASSSPAAAAAWLAVGRRGDAAVDA